MASLPSPPPRPAGETCLSRRGYAVDKRPPENAELLLQLRRELTVQPKLNPNAPRGGGGASSFPVFLESSKKLYLPRVFGLRMLGTPTRDALGPAPGEPGEPRDPGIGDRLAFAGSLRPEQLAPVDAFLAAAADPARRGGIISLQCGGGKTCCALYVASVLRVKTLVICHKEFLLNQWRERAAQFLPAARVGVVKAKRVEVEGKDLVLASLQSLALKDYAPGVLDGFGLVVCDECHHLSAEVFCRALPKVTSPVMLGLSATLDRKDGLRRVFEWFLGPPVYEQGGGRDDTSLRVRVVRFPAAGYPSGTLSPHDPFGTRGRVQGQQGGYGVVRLLPNGKPNVSRMINEICAHAPRDAAMLDELEAVLRREPRRRTLVLSDRRAHLRALEEAIAVRGLGSVGWYVGGMKEAALKESESKDILLGTVAMVSEGFDVPALNTLVLASPISSLEQPLGRIQRQKAAERAHVPLVIDVWDQFSLFHAQGMRRLRFYKQAGYSTSMAGIVDADADADAAGGEAAASKLPAYAFTEAL